MSWDVSFFASALSLEVWVATARQRQPLGWVP